MSNRIVVALALFASLSFAAAAGKPARNWAKEFYPTATQTEAVCHDGYLASKKPNGDSVATPHSGYTFDADWNAKYAIIYQFPLGGAFNQCRAQGKTLEPEKADSQYHFMLYVGGGATDLAAASKWTAAIQVNDTTGAEITRINPGVSPTKLGDPAHWEKDCAKSPCVWAGHNLFVFALGDAGFKAAILAGGTPRLLLLRGRGFENIPFPTYFPTH